MTCIKEKKRKENDNDNDQFKPFRVKAVLKQVGILPFGTPFSKKRKKKKNNNNSKEKEKQQSLWYHRYLDSISLFSHLDVVTRENAVPCSNLTSPPVVVAIRLL